MFLVARILSPVKSEASAPCVGPTLIFFFMSVFYDKGLDDMWTEIFASLPLEEWKPSPGSPQVHFSQAERHKEHSAKEFLDVKALLFLYF